MRGVIHTRLYVWSPLHESAFLVKCCILILSEFCKIIDTKKKKKRQFLRKCSYVIQNFCTNGIMWWILMKYVLLTTPWSANGTSYVEIHCFLFSDIKETFIMSGEEFLTFDGKNIWSIVFLYHGKKKKKNVENETYTSVPSTIHTA